VSHRSWQRGLDPALVKAIARGHKWFEDLVTGRARSLVEIAKAEGVTRRYVGRLLPLALIAPDIIASVLAGTQPVHLKRTEYQAQVALYARAIATATGDSAPGILLIV
jgi:hypothetical protein